MTVWIVSTGRSGTTFIADLLSLSPDITCLHEPEPAYHWHNWQPLNPLDAPKRRRRISTTDGIYGESNYNLSVWVPTILENDPNAVAVYLYRDPRSWVASAFQHDWHERWKFYDSPFLSEPKPKEPHLQMLYIWRTVDAVAAHIRDRWPERILDVKCSALWCELSEALRLFDWLGATRPDATEIIELQRQRLNSRDAGKAGRPIWNYSWDKHLSKSLGIYPTKP